jgi:hypothetical protein
MQTIGHIIDERTNEKILVLVRIGKKIDKFCFVVDIKIRNLGKEGQIISENDYFNANPELIDALKAGKVIYC